MSIRNIGKRAVSFLERIISEKNNEQIEIFLLELFACYIVVVTLDGSVIGELYPIISRCFKLIRYLFYLVCALNILRNLIIYRFDHVTPIVFSLFVLSLLIFIISRRQYPLCLCIVLGGLYRIPLKKLIKCALSVSIAVFLFLITLSVLNIIPDWTYLRGDGNVRHALGYDWPGNTAKALFLIYLMYFYFYQKVSSKEIAFLFLSAILIYYLTDARTDFILCVVTILLMRIMTNTNALKKKCYNKSIKIIIILLPWLLTGGFVIFCILFSHNFLIAQKLDVLLSSRIKLTLNAYKQYGITLFGQQISWKGWGGVGYTIAKEGFKYNYIDNAFMQMMFDYGILFLFAFLFSSSLAVYNAVKKNDLKLVLVYTLLFVWASIEPSILEVGRNVFLVSIAQVLTMSDGIVDLQRKSSKKIKTTRSK